MTFLSDIQVSRAAGKSGEWTLTADLIYLGNRDQFLVPKGFKTDFASIPRVFQSLIPSHGRFDAAAIVHDYLYRHKPKVIGYSGWGDYKRITRKEADGVFRRIMKELGVGRIRRNLMYRAVRMGGWAPWGKSRKLLG
jgi:hypothetical protein